jgi:alpha-glucosidase (family GH31 glycosyl hydrolase)
LLLENNEYGVYVKGGSILPIKLHQGAQSILRTLLMPIRLDIYLSISRTTAQGVLYLDDGESFKYKLKKEKALIRYVFKDNILGCESLYDASYVYEPSYSLKITEVNIYGLDR